MADAQEFSVPVAQAVLRRRAENEARRDRFLNAKQRMIGCDKAALDAQLQEKAAIEAAETAQLQAENHAQTQVDGALRMLEVERRRMHREATADTVRFNHDHLSKDKRREYDLSDPQALQKQDPTRSDAVDEESGRVLVDGRLGVSSVQIFAGEDLERKARVKAQQAQQAKWLAQQVEEKKAIAAYEKNADLSFELAANATVGARAELEKEERRLRAALTKQGLDWNASKVKAKEETNGAGGRFLRSQEERIADYRELAHHAQDEFLNETSDMYCPDGRIRRDHFRGLPKEAHVANQEGVRAQIAYDSHKNDHIKSEDLHHDGMMEQARKAVVQMEKTKADVHKQVTHELLTEGNESLRRSAAEGGFVRAHEGLDSVKNNGMDTNEVFKHFGSGCR